MTAKPSNPQHLKWAIQARARNQENCLVLLSLLSENKRFWSTKKNSRVAQALVAVGFSLWRAAFLADKNLSRGNVLDSGIEFLTQILEENSVTFSFDRKTRSWTFNYYITNAQSSLRKLAKYGNAKPWVDDNRIPTVAWDYATELFQDALKIAEARVSEHNKGLEAKKQKKLRRERKAVQKAIVR